MTYIGYVTVRTSSEACVDGEKMAGKVADIANAVLAWVDRCVQSGPARLGVHVKLDNEDEGGVPPDHVADIFERVLRGAVARTGTMPDDVCVRSRGFTTCARLTDSSDYEIVWTCQRKRYNVFAMLKAFADGNTIIDATVAEAWGETYNGMCSLTIRRHIGDISEGIDAALFLYRLMVELTRTVNEHGTAMPWKSSVVGLTVVSGSRQPNCSANRISQVLLSLDVIDLDGIIDRHWRRVPIWWVIALGILYGDEADTIWSIDPDYDEVLGISVVTDKYGCSDVKRGVRSYSFGFHTVTRVHLDKPTSIKSIVVVDLDVGRYRCVDVDDPEFMIKNVYIDLDRCTVGLTVEREETLKIEVWDEELWYSRMMYRPIYEIGGKRIVKALVTFDAQGNVVNFEELRETGDFMYAVEKLVELVVTSRQFLSTLHN